MSIHGENAEKHGHFPEKRRVLVDVHQTRLARLAAAEVEDTLRADESEALALRKKIAIGRRAAYRAKRAKAEAGMWAVFDAMNTEPNTGFGSDATIARLENLKHEIYNVYADHCTRMMLIVIGSNTLTGRDPSINQALTELNRFNTDEDDASESDAA